MRTILTAVAALGLLGVACGDDDGAEDVEETVEQAQARAAAEWMRGDLLGRDLRSDEHLRDVSVLEDSAENIPGSPDVTGIDDTTGDGRDDDGNVEIVVGDEAACVRVSEDGDSVDVEGGTCD
jgi:hypothetical protein